jgi:phage terminase large subunit-like protein
VPRASSRKAAPLPECGYRYDPSDETAAPVVCLEHGDHLCIPRALHAVAFFSEILVHTKGLHARKRFVPADWQREEVLVPLFGCVRWDADLLAYVRQYVVLWLEIARKNGKSELVAGIGLYLLCADGEEAGEVYGCARDRDQAGAIFGVAKRMVELSPELSTRLRIIESQKRIIDPSTESFYRVIAADALGNLGWNVSGVLFDEVITQRDGALWDALMSSMGTRSQPLFAAATTAGDDPSSFAFEEHMTSLAVMEDPKVDPRRLAVIHSMPAELDWRDEKNWPLGNPALGDFLQPKVLRAEALEAARSPRKQNAFRQFRCNQWVRQIVRWLDLDLWDENAGMVVEEELAGRTCFAGLDLASTSDFCAFVMFFPGVDEEDDYVVCRFWLPEAALERRSSMRDTLLDWAAQDYLTLTEGAVIDHATVFDGIDDCVRKFDVQTMGYDRWNASQLVRDLEDSGLECEGVAQTCAGLNAGSRDLERRLGMKRLHHGGHPLLRWMADNVTSTQDNNENIKPDKKKSTEKIDGVVALVMALRQALEAEGSGAWAITLNLQEEGSPS